MTDATIPTGPTSWDYVLAIINTKPVIALVTALASAWGVTWWQGDTAKKEVAEIQRVADKTQIATESAASEAVDVIINACIAQLKAKKK